MSRSHWSTGFCLCCCLYLRAGAVLAEDDFLSGLSRYQAPKEPVALAAMAGTVNLDGKLDEVVWQKSPKLPIAKSYPDGATVESGAFWQVAADAEAIYMAVTVPQSKPQFAQPTGKDQWEGDLIEFFLDARQPQRQWQFCASPIGLRYDEQAGNTAWEGNWVAKGEVKPAGWTLEARFPFADLGVDKLPKGETWHTNLCLINGGAYVAWTGNWGDPAQFAPLFFGDEQVWLAHRQADLAVTCGLAYVNQHDAVAPIQVVTGFDGDGLDRAQLRVSFRTQQGIEKTQTAGVPPRTGDALRFSLSLAGVGYGLHEVRAELLWEGQAKARGAMRLAKREDRLALAKSGLTGPVALRQTSESPANLDSWAFVTAVPLPRGVLNDTTAVQLRDEQGGAIAAQFGPLTHWSPARQSIKWLRVAFTAPSHAGRTPRYRLSFGEKTEPMPCPSPVRITDGRERLEIDTGAVTLWVSKTSGSGFSTAKRGFKTVYDAAKDDGPYVVDHTGAVFRGCLDSSPAVTVEENGPIRAVVRAEFWHMRDRSTGSQSDSPAGDRLNKSILRYYVYAGQPWVELHWTFIVTADTTKVAFRDMGLKMAGRGAAQIGLEEGRHFELSDGYLLQKTPDLYVVRKPGGDGYLETARGAKAPGWMATDGFCLVMRDFWQMFPKELEVSSAGRKTALTLHAWPRHGEYNSDWFIEPETSPAPDAPHERIAGPNGVTINPVYFQNCQKWHHGSVLDFSLPEWWRNPNMAGTREARTWLDPYTGCGNYCWEYWILWAKGETPPDLKETALGTSRTQELLLDFSGDEPGVLAARRAMFIAQPHVWLDDPQWLDDTRVLGPMNVSAARNWLGPQQAGWKRVIESGHVGMWVWGNLPEYWCSKNEHAAIYRMMAGGGHYGGLHTDWLLYMCTGESAHLKCATAWTRQDRDVHGVHYTTPEFQSGPQYNQKTLGGRTLMSPYPWRGTEGWRICAPILWDYYLTGDRRSLEVAECHARPVVLAARGSLDRGTGVIMKFLLDWYRHSWDPEAAAKIDQIVGWIASADPTAKGSKTSTPLNWTNFMPEYLILTEDPTLPLRQRESLLEFVQAWCKEHLSGADVSATTHGQNPGNMLAGAWLATGDRKYLMPFVRWAKQSKLPRDKWLAPPPGGGDAVCGRLNDLLMAYAAWRDAVGLGLLEDNSGTQ